MGAGSPPAQTTTTSKSEQRLPLYAIPYGRELLSRGVAESRRPYMQYGGQRIANRDPLMKMGLRGIGESVGANQGLFNLGRSTFADLLNPNQEDPLYDQLRSVSAGDYLSPDSNPYLKDTYNTAAQAVTDQYQNAIAPQRAAQAAQAGAFGGSAYSENRFRDQYDLGRNLSELSTDIYGGAYESERNRQLASQQVLADMLAQQEAMRAGVATAIPGFAAGEQGMYNTAYQMGSLDRDISQSVLDLQYANWMEQMNYPLSRLDILGSILAQSTGRGGSSTSSVTGPGFQARYSPWAGAAGGALAGYGATDSYYGAGLGALLGGLGGY